MANTFTRVVEQGIGLGPTTIGNYTVAASTTVTVIGLTLANILAQAITVSVKLVNGGTEVYLVKDAPVPTGSSLIPVGGDQKLVLETGDNLQVESSDNMSVDVIMSLLEST